MSNYHKKFQKLQQYGLSFADILQTDNSQYGNTPKFCQEDQCDLWNSLSKIFGFTCQIFFRFICRDNALFYTALNIVLVLKIKSLRFFLL